VHFVVRQETLRVLFVLALLLLKNTALVFSSMRSFFFSFVSLLSLETRRFASLALAVSPLRYFSSESTFAFCSLLCFLFFPFLHLHSNQVLL
jgi:hypothetical protein